MIAEPYTRAETELDHDWCKASPEQRSAAFNVLLGAAIAYAETGDEHFAQILRKLRAERDAS